jgi:hypothetical protein
MRDYLPPHLKEKLESHDFFMLAKSCRGLWIVKVRTRSLEASLGAMISLETITMLTWSNMGVSHQMTSRHVCSRVELDLKIETIHLF